jgi:hypothetical protein
MSELALPSVPTREQIVRLEGLLLQLPQETLETVHHFADGLVSRTIRIPAGTLLTGAPHKSEHLNVCHGDITVWTEDGMRRLTGYHVLPSKPGAKRVGQAHGETFWTTIHANPTNCRDIEALEDMLVEAEGLQSRRLAYLKATPLEALA